MLSTAFDLLCHDGKEWLTPEQLLNILRKCDMHYEWPLDVPDGDRLEMMVPQPPSLGSCLLARALGP